MVGSQTSIVMKVRNANAVYTTPDPKRTPAWLLDGPRRSTVIWTARLLQSDYSPLREIRRLEELYGLMASYDGLGEFGADLFPIKTPVGGYATPAAGAGTGWVSPGRSTLALLYPGPDGPVATERFEMFREGVELCEAVLFLRNVLYTEQLLGDLQQRVERYVMPNCSELPAGSAYGSGVLAPLPPWREVACSYGARELAFNRGAFAARYMQAEEDARLLDLAGEVVEDLRISGAAKSYGAKATGGTFTNLTDGFWVHRFMAVGTNPFTPTEDITVEYLVVGGGGSGGGAAGSGAWYTGGGGAGGLITSVSSCRSGGGTPGTGSAPNQPVRLKAGTAYNVTVGDGGASVTSGGNNGQDSVFGNVGNEFARAKGGGGGGRDGAGGTGGSGGGGGNGTAGSGTANQGCNGGGGAGGSNDSGGGGGGAGGVGLSSGAANANGGPGLTNSITGGNIVYAGGGGGGSGQGHTGNGGSNVGGNGGGTNPGVNGRGGGGGGGCNAAGGGGQGGSGIVIIRYKVGGGK
jgi:hypothetical protein